MQTSDSDTLPRAHGSEQNSDQGKEQGQTVDIELTAQEELNKDIHLASNTENTQPRSTNQEETHFERREQPELQGSPATIPSRAVASSLHSGLSISEHVSLIVDELRRDEDLGDAENMPLPEPDTDLGENVLEVDDEEDDSMEPYYAASHYPSIPVRYRVERLDAPTINSSSRSIFDEELDYVEENGRRYCGNYIFPNDDEEQDRLRVVHQVFLNAFDEELTSVPLEDPTRILDVGTGTGEWAIGMAEKFPECEVIGLDISAIQPTAVPFNVFFEIDDCTRVWVQNENSFDLVHLRDMAGAFDNWDNVYREAFSCLKPGGYIEVLDFHDQTGQEQTFLSSFPADAKIHEYVRAIDEASIKAERRRGAHHLTAERLQRMGFVDVRISEHTLPLNAYSDRTAKIWLVACLATVEAGSLRLLTKHLGWDADRAQTLCEEVRQEIKEKAIRPPNDLQISLRVLSARKPPLEVLGLLQTRRDADSATVDSNDANANGLVPSHGHSEDESTIGR